MSAGAGFKPDGAHAVFAGEPKKMALSPSLLGHVFNGKGELIDGSDKQGYETVALQYRDINGAAINPY